MNSFQDGSQILNQTTVAGFGNLPDMLPIVLVEELSEQPELFVLF